MSETYSDQPIQVVIQQKGSPGLIAALFGCAFGLLGIFTFAFLFSTLGLLCAGVGFILAVFGRNMTGVGVSVLAALLSVVAALKSPIVLLLLGVGLLASAMHQPPAAHAVAVSPTAVAQAPASAGVPSASNAQPSGAPAVDRPALLNQAADWAVTETAAADDDLAKIPATDQRYRTITAQMENWAAQRADLPEDQALQRGRLATAISQGEVSANLQHDRVTLLQSGLQRSAMPNAQHAHELMQSCQDQGGAAGDSGPACDRLAAALDPLDKKFALLADGLAGLETTYQQEHARQQSIIDHLYD